MNNAYMIRADGKLFPVTVHMYGSPDDVEETLGITEWLYTATNDASTRAAIIDLWASYAAYLDPDVTKTEIAPTLIYHLKHLPYKVASPAFINSLNFGNAKIYQDLNAINLAVNDALNQEFLRARYGGMYDTSAGDRAMYFRISSTGFNWFPIIWAFVYDNRRQIDSVTVVKDPEATGMDNRYLIHGNTKIDHVPTEEFINLSGRPVFDSYKSVDTLYSNMNSVRRHHKIHLAHTKDVAFVSGPEFSREGCGKR